MNALPTQAGAALARARRTLAHHKSRAKAQAQVLDYNLADLWRLIEGSPCCRWHQGKHARLVLYHESRYG